MEHFTPNHFDGPEAIVPAPLLQFLQHFGTAQSTDETWGHLRQLSAAFGLGQVAYFQSVSSLDDPAEQPQDWRIVTTATQACHDRLAHSPMALKLAASDPNGVKMTPTFLHVRDPLVSDATHRRQMAMLQELDMTTAFAIPVISGDAFDKAVMVFGSHMHPDEFMSQIERFGCSLHIAAMASHARYVSLYKQEFVLRTRLTDKQSELIRLVGMGLLDKQIAHQLGISFSAVRQRLAAVQQKTGARNRAHLAAMAMRIDLTADALMANPQMAAG
ncbi:helix-turn-helix transcriptional regulator [Pelagimonas varians]|uniref:Bacterial regulatory proteins, luxR family n=1 Tax=Pelagimonas varians TaxID=696760 RepID=A0A238KTZ3_9RHOB|nr:helix-turn-helix transcriptional regulator [Pelagimonas varians]PYG28232.1 regulatory LuxR family protein [Pelagimonas varians]SMX46275.1 Bacterial regulatory proteins, luxR family [Pelagimonas varians]